MARIPQRTLRISRGDRFVYRAEFRDSTGAPEDMSGLTWAGQLRVHPDATAILASFTFDTTDAATGIVLFILEAVDTTGLSDTPAGTWDAQGTTALGHPRTFVGGKFRLKKDTTR